MRVLAPSTLLLFFVFALPIGCADAPSSGLLDAADATVGPDDAAPFDTGVRPDSGVRPDAGRRRDASVRPDALAEDTGEHQGPELVLGETTELPVPPPPLSGGTLAISRDGARVLAADPDRDLVYVVELSTLTRITTALQAGDEPGRLVEDGSGRVHVVLRSGGAIVTLDATSGAILERRAVCSAPRGVAWDREHDTLVVACARGEVVELAASGGLPIREVHLDRDLRDVVWADGRLYVTRFRSAELLELDETLTVIQRVRPRALDLGGGDGFAPHVAWRALAHPLGGVAWVHQEAATGEIDRSGDYGTPQSGHDAGIVDDSGRPVSCPPSDVARATISILATRDLTPRRVPVPSAVLPVDVAFSPSGAVAAVVAGANGAAPSLAQIVVVEPSPPTDLGCRFETTVGPRAPTFETTSIVFRDEHTIVAQSREPAALAIIDLDVPAGPVIIPLAESSARDTGHTLFHATTSAGVACASCHPEGHEDAHTWRFLTGRRRTPSLRGTIAGTAPYRWDGAAPELALLLHVDFAERMRGMTLRADQLDALVRYTSSFAPFPATPAPDPVAVERGRAIFEGVGGCSSCHFGPAFTNNATTNLGTNGAYQTPSLVGMSWRGPFFHDGCAETLRGGVTVACAGSPHAVMSLLWAPDLEDLLQYLDTL